MFKSTYGYIEGQSQFGLFSNFAYKAVDFNNNIEIFKIGEEDSPDDPSYGTVYCLKKNSSYIPFGIKSYSIKSYVSIKDLDVSKHGYRNPKARIPVVNVNIFQFGVNLKDISVGPRGRLEYLDCWHNDEFHGYGFSSQSEKDEAFSYLQEALPVLFFDDYCSLCYSKPAICTNIQPYDEKGFTNIDKTGDIESKSIILKPKTEKPESPEVIIKRMEEKSIRSAFTIEEIMSELIDAERGNLFFGNLFVSTIINDDRFGEILRDSYQEYYQDKFSNFCRFFTYLTDIVKLRLSARQVYEKFAYV